MRILVITAAFPYPLASGGAIRTFGIIHGLHQAGHELTLLSFTDRDISETPIPAYCEAIHLVPTPQRSKVERLKTLLLTNQADISTRFKSTDFEQKLRDLLTTQQFDLIQFEAIESVAYLPIARQLQPTAKICFDTFNAEYMLQRKIYEIDRTNLKRLPAALYSYLQINRIARFEGEMCQLADCVIAVSDEDAELLKDFRADKKIHIMQSGVFVEDYKTVDEKVDLPLNSLVFTGKMDYRPNVDAMLWFTAEILPHIRARVPDVQLYIVGQQPSDRLEALTANENIHITGWVDSTIPYLHEATVYVAPLRMGSGTRLKLLEAMSSRCAIVATTLASAGLHSETKQGMIVADEPEDFANAVVELLQNQQKRQYLGEVAQKEVKKRYDWSALIHHLLSAYKDIGLG
ncbi:MAG: glycosyltransferase [Aggregatilineales bacterium]